MGRAFGIFLLVVGIGLAAYGLPTSETGWPSATATGPASGQAVVTKPSPSSLGDLIIPHSAGHGPGSGPVSAIGPMTAAPTPQGNLAPMDKLRAAGHTARAIASGQEPVGSYQPSSQVSALELPPVPRPVEAPPTVRAAPPAPSVIAAARRETMPLPAKDARELGKNTAPGASGGWTTVVSQVAPHTKSDPSQGGAKLFADTTGSEGSNSRVAAPTRAATIAVSSGDGRDDDRTVTSLQKAPIEIVGKSIKSGLVAELPRLQQLAQRPTPAPPVYLGGKSSSGSGSSGSAGSTPKRGFKSQEFWESNRQSGM